MSAVLVDSSEMHQDSAPQVVITADDDPIPDVGVELDAWGDSSQEQEPEVAYKKTVSLHNITDLAYKTEMGVIQGPIRLMVFSFFFPSPGRYLS